MVKSTILSEKEPMVKEPYLRDSTYRRYLDLLISFLHDMVKHGTGFFLHILIAIYPLILALSVVFGGRSDYSRTLHQSRKCPPRL
jgi:hypothetical protein